jgi:hypothetical protein
MIRVTLNGKNYVVAGDEVYTVFWRVKKDGKRVQIEREVWRHSALARQVRAHAKRSPE